MRSTSILRRVGLPALLALAVAGCGSDSPTDRFTEITIDLNTLTATFTTGTSPCPFDVEPQVAVTNTGTEAVTVAFAGLPAGLQLLLARPMIEPGQGTLVDVQYDCSQPVPYDQTFQLVATSASGGQDTVTIRVIVNPG